MNSRLQLLAAMCGVAAALGAAGTSVQAQVELVSNGGFETGTLAGWTSEKFDNSSQGGGWTINNGTLRLSEFAAPTAPISGSYDAVSFQFAGGWRALTSAAMTVPDNVTGAVLSWSDRIRNWDLFNPTFAPGQSFRVEILDAGFAPLGSAPVFSTANGDPKIQIGPNHRAVDVTGLLQSQAGQPIHIRFEQDDLNFLFNVNVDNVSLLVVTAPPPPPDPDPDPPPEPDPEPIQVLLDVKPGDGENAINLKVNSKSKGKGDAAGGVLPVAILTTDDFDAAFLDLTLISLGDPRLSHAAFPIDGKYEDIDLDGDIDLVLRFNILNMVSLGAIDQQTTSLHLAGFTVDGDDVYGDDAVRILAAQKEQGKSSSEGPKTDPPAPETKPKKSKK